ncbi:MAG: SLOG family protein [Oscillospiraceae bacterium]
MRVAVIGSRNLMVQNLEQYLPKDVTEIVSGGARGVDTSAKEYALSHHIKLTEFLPDYDKYGRSAPLKRNITIIENADLVLAFWDGKSRGTKFVIDNCKQRAIPIKVFLSKEHS